MYLYPALLSVDDNLVVLPRLNHSREIYNEPSPPRNNFTDSKFVKWENRATLTKHRDTYPFIDPFRFQNTLRGKVVLITLAHRGIGRASAVAFAQAGASICCVGPTSKCLEPVILEIRQKFNTPTLALGADILAPNTPSQIVAFVEQHLGPIDILVNITPPSYLRPFAQEPNITTDWWSSLEQNLRAPIELIHAVLPSMIARHRGTIISTTFVVAAQDFPFISSSSVAKAGLLKFHQQLDLEVREKGITSFAVHPGLIPSHLHDPDNPFTMDPDHFAKEPRLQALIAKTVGEVIWAAAGLASGTFVALCAEPRAKILSGLYVNAERDLGEVISEMEMDPERVEREKLYVLKVDEF
jgi:NAD(P)-dependent dehydrogenase (short-subunit alcohol dehydrogenase family)